MRYDMNEILPGLYMGAAFIARPKQINAILDLIAHHEDILHTNGLHAFMWLPIEDHPEAAPDVFWLAMAVNTVSAWLTNGWTVLIHCLMGHSRSGMVTTAYVMKTQKLHVDEALAFVRTKRASCNPNIGFLNSLQKYDQYLQDTNYAG